MNIGYSREIIVHVFFSSSYNEIDSLEDSFLRVRKPVRLLPRGAAKAPDSRRSLVRDSAAVGRYRHYAQSG